MLGKFDADNLRVGLYVCNVAHDFRLTVFFKRALRMV